MKEAMSDSFLTKEVGTLGDGAGETTELRILNRVVRWGPEGLTYEADPRHVDILRQGIAGAARSLSAPGTLSRDLNPGEDQCKELEQGPQAVNGPGQVVRKGPGSPVGSSIA